MNSWAIWGIPTAVIFTIAMLGIATTNISNVDAVVTGDTVTVTVTYPKFTLKADEVTVLLDTTGSGTLSTIHVAANLPCDLAAPAIPEVKIVAGVAPVDLIAVPLVHVSAVLGVSGTCVYHGDLDATSVPAVMSITDVILASTGLSRVVMPAGSTITITGTYA